MLRRFLLIMGISAGTFIVSVLEQNAISDWFSIEEAVLFTIAVFLCPVAFSVGAVGSIVLGVTEPQK